MTPEEALREFRAADNAYHGLCVDIQEPDVPVAELPLAELAAVAERLRLAALALADQG